MQRVFPKNQSAFTLIEILVAAAVFCIIIVSIASVSVSSVRLQRHNLTSQQMLSQASYSLEYMARFIRMAKKDSDGLCTGGTAWNYSQNSSSEISFRDYNNQCQKFYLEGGKIKQNGTMVMPNGTNAPINGLDITSGNFEVKNLNFAIVGEREWPADDYQPRVTIFIEMEGTGVFPHPKISVQTTVSQRDIDVPDY